MKEKRVQLQDQFGNKLFPRIKPEDQNLGAIVSDTPPKAIDGRIYYNSKEKLFYVARGGIWDRLYVAGDEELEQKAPEKAPELESKTDTTVRLKEQENMEYRYQGGAWQESTYFSNLQRNESYLFEQRFKADGIYKESDPSPALTVRTDKGTQSAPGQPTISNIEHSKATVKGESNTEVSLDRENWYSSPHTFTGLSEKTEYTAYARKKETDTHKPSPASAGRTFTTDKGTQSAPGQPTVSNIEHDRATVNGGSGTEVRLDSGAWYSSPHTFTGLSKVTKYTAYARRKETDTHKPSPISVGRAFTTDKGTQSAPSKPTVTNIQHDRATVRGETNTEVSLDKSTWYSSPHTFTGLREVTKYTAYARRKETNTHNVSPASSGATFTTDSDKDDKSGSPGSAKLKKGTMREGYFGSASSSQLISGDSLASKVGVTEGLSEHSDTPWHKFAYKNKILFVAQKPIRIRISWGHLNSKGVVHGDKTIEINGIKYKVRLLKGALTDPSDFDASDKGAKGSEWNRLILPLHEQRKDNNWSFKGRYVENDLQDWGTYLSSDDMAVNGYGRAAWCQEVGGDYSDHRVSRGIDSVCDSYTDTLSSRYSHFGWRPVLEVI